MISIDRLTKDKILQQPSLKETLNRIEQLAIQNIENRRT